MNCADSMAGIHTEMASLRAHISGLVDALNPGTNEPWEKVELLTFGGPVGNYNIQAPFLGECQYSIQNISASAAAIIQISPKFLSPQVYSFTSSPVSYSANSGYNGFIFNVSSTQTPVPVMSEWTTLSNSSNTLYMRVDMAAANAAYVAIMFRQKRIVR